jgi:hypothetical protein
MGAARIDLKSSEALMQRRCSRCHALDRVVGARKDAQGWLVAVNRMWALPGSGITESDAKVILSYLISESSIDSSSAQGELAVGKALVDSHCNRCHGHDRTYQSIKSPAEWKDTVMRMVKYARGTEGFFKPGEDQRIVYFLAMTQTSEAAQARLSSPTDLTPDSRRPITKVEPAEDLRAASNLPTVGVTVLIADVFGPLMWRRPKSPSQKGGTASATSADVESATRVTNIRRSIILQLVRTERQTHDCVSLRFRIMVAGALRHRPGQFLTFDWLLDGQKLGDLIPYPHRRRKRALSKSPSKNSPRVVFRPS